MSKKQVIDYVMNSPANTNKAVLEGMLDGVGGADVPTPTVEDAGKVLGVNENGKYSFNNVDCGFSCTEAYTLLTDETVTTEADGGDENVGILSYTSQIIADLIRVTFNGTVYDCPKQTAQGATLYGGWSNEMPDFSVFPFAIYSAQDNGISTSTAGTYTVKLEEVNSTVTTTNCFQKAVKSVVDADSNRVIVTIIGNGYGNITDASRSPTRSVERRVKRQGCYIKILP